MATLGLRQLVVVALTLTVTAAVAVRKEQVFVMEVRVEEAERQTETESQAERLTSPGRMKALLEMLRPQGMEKASEKLDEGAGHEVRMVKLQSSSFPPSLPALVQMLGLSDLYGAVGAAGLAAALSGPGPFTLFAPTNKAFVAAKDWVDKLTSNVTALREVLTYHVLAAKVLSKDIKDEVSVNTLQGKPIRFNIYPNNKVVTAQCAPIDLSNADKIASNGVLHELKALMIPPVSNIAETASQIGAFSTLVNLLVKADLVDTLKNGGPFTVFAPTNTAFDKLPPGVLDQLTKNKTALTDVLLYHVVKLTYCLPGLVSYTKVQTLNNQDLKVTVSGDEVKVNNIEVMPAGVEGGVTNGVIHVINSVLIPPSLHSWISTQYQQNHSK